MFFTAFSVLEENIQPDMFLFSFSPVSYTSSIILSISTVVPLVSSQPERLNRLYLW